MIILHLLLIAPPILAIRFKQNEGVKNVTKNIPNEFSSTSTLIDDYPISSKKLICFYVFTTDFNPELLHNLCTHIVVGFLVINKENFTVRISQEQEQILSQFTLYKNKTKDVKILISIGGAGDTGFSSMVTNHISRKKFIRSCMTLIKQFKLDGLDLDWEWPVLEDGNLKEKVKFVQLFNEIRQEFNLHKHKYILSADVSSSKTLIDLSYYVNYIADVVDFINVMGYDYHFYTKYYPFTGHNAPLFSSEKDLLFNNVNFSINYWITKKMPREKINLGVPTYGHTYELSFSNKHSLTAPSKGYGSVGNNGFASYPEICEFIKSKNATVIFDLVSEVPYAFKFPEWISYDNEKSIAIKADYILKENLGGAMVFSVNVDDYNGSCSKNGVTFPLIKQLRNILLNAV